jgi:hypothetical protein
MLDKLSKLFLGIKTMFRQKRCVVPKDFSEYTSVLRVRSAKLRHQSTRVIILIIVVLIGGGLAFYYAGEWASRESTQALALDKQSKISVLQREIDADNRSLAENKEEITLLNRRISESELDEKSLKSLQSQLTQALKEDETIHQSIEKRNQQLVGLREGSSVVVDPQVSPSLYGTLVSAIATRVGSIILLLFLVRILVPLYRYNIRLAFFYDARADALDWIRLSNNEGDEELFEKLTHHLSPDSIDFGKAPASPTQELLDFVRGLVTSKKAE